MWLLRPGQHIPRDRWLQGSQDSNTFTIMKNLISVLFLLISCLPSFGQDLVIKGRVIDYETLLPLPYATIEIFSLQTGTIADINGDFEIAIDSLVTRNDTMVVSHLGYTKKSILISDYFNGREKLITLKSTYVNLEEVVVLPGKYKTINIGITKRKPDGKQITNVFNSMIGNFIENKRGEDGWVKSVSYYVHPDGKPQTPFRVRIYDFDIEKRCPGKDLLTENVIVSAKGPGWFTIDLSEFNIQFPSNGAYIMMEWINSGQQYFYETEARTLNENGEVIFVTREFYGQTIGSVLNRPEMLTWGKGLGNDWIPFKLHTKGFINAMINADITYIIN
jgi:hypothetical protein